MLRSACIENRQVPRDQIIAIRYDLFDDDPPEVVWLDSDTVARLELPTDRTLELDDIEAIDCNLEPICGNCFDDWLQLNGIDPLRSPEEKRFTHLADQLRDLAG